MIGDKYYIEHKFVNGIIIYRIYHEYLGLNKTEVKDYKYKKCAEKYIKKLYEKSKDTLNKFEEKLNKLGIHNLDPLYYVTGAKNCHTIEETNEYYDSLPSYSSINYKKDGKDVTQKIFNFIDKHRELAHKYINTCCLEFD